MTQPPDAASQKEARRRWVKDRPHAELYLLAHLLAGPQEIAYAATLVRSSDFLDPTLARYYEALIACKAKLETVDRMAPNEAIAIAAAVCPDPQAAMADLRACYAAANYEEFYGTESEFAVSHYGSAIVEAAATRLRKLLAETRNLTDADLDRLVDFRRRLEGIEASETYLARGVTGQALLDASSDPIPDPVIPGVLWPGHVNLLAGVTTQGKTFLAIHGALSVALGRQPWKWPENGPTPGRVLLLSRDDTTPEIARRMRQLEPKETTWSDRIHVVGKELQPARLDRPGIELLRATLSQALDEARPFAGVVVDPLMHFAPEGADLNSDSTAVELIGPLEQLCIEYGCWVWALHHLRKRGGRERGGGEQSEEDLLDRVRNSGAIVSLARAVAVMERTEPHLRKITAWSNIGPTPGATILRVSDTSTTGRIDYFKLAAEPETLPDMERIFGERDLTFSEFTRALFDIDDRRASQSERREAKPIWELAIRLGILEPAGSRRGYQSFRVSDAPRPVPGLAPTPERDPDEPEEELPLW